MQKPFATTITRDGDLDMRCPACKSHNTSLIHTGNFSSKIEKIVCNTCGYTLLRSGVTPPLSGQMSIEEFLK